MPRETLKDESVTFIEIAEDRMTARFAGVAEGATVTAAEVLAALERDHVRITDAVRARVAEHTTDAGIFNAGPGTVLATGVAAVDDVPGELRMLDHQPTADGLAALDPHARCGLAIVAKNQAIAEAIAFVKGSDGVDVQGRVIPRGRSAAMKITLGRNVACLADGKTIAAQASGCLHVEGLRIFVEPRLSVPGNVDFSTGNIHFDGDIAIGGTVLDLFAVWTSGDVHVHGAVEAARVEAGRDLLVDGGIMGKEKGTCRAGRNIHAKYVTNAELTAQGDVVVRKEVVNTRVVCGGSLTVEAGVLVGGHITARGGVTCGALGSEAEVHTLVEVGVDAALRDSGLTLIAALEAKQRKALALRQEGTLMQTQGGANGNSLAVEKLRAAATLEAEAEAELNQLRQRLAAADAATGDVHVKEAVFPGVTIRCGPLQTLIAERMPGPVQIGVRDTAVGQSLAAVNPLTGSVTRLPHQQRVADDLDQLRRFIGKAANPKPGG